MKSFFDYCYYRIAKFHSRWFSEEPEDIAKYILALFQSSNVIFLVAILFMIAKWTMTSVHIVVIMAVILVVDSKFFCHRERYLELCERWDNESKKSRRIKGWYVLLYMAVSIALCVRILLILKDLGLLVANLSYGIDWGKMLNK